MPVENGSTPESPPAVEPVQAPVAASAAAPNSDTTTATPSPAKDESLMDRVTAALKPKTEGSSPSPGSQDDPPNPETSPESDDKEPEGDPTDEELARYHSRTRRRMNKLMGERNQARDEVEKLRPDAEVGQRITAFVRDSGMSGDEANLLLEIGKNMKQNPLKAWEQLQPYVAALQQMAGERLPEDLQSAVTKGEITEPYARQIARGRTETSVLSRRTQAQEQEAERNRAAQQSEQHGQQVSSAISTWDRNQAASDPDWNLKQGRIGELIELDIRRNGFPKTAQAAIDQAEKAKSAVNADFARLRPQRTAVNTLNPASTARPAPAKPKTALEAVDQALARAAG